MRFVTVLLVAGLCLAGAYGCSHPKPPEGKWEGTYESDDTMVVARLQIDSNGSILVSAPNAQDLTTMSPDDKASVRQKLAQDLANGWDSVEPRKLDFDGTTFRKQGGVAPQMEWDAANSHMTLIVYFGTNPAIRIPLHAVKEFSDNPWS
ncbi:MAG TPA: hypothetical protein VLW75_04780 [Rhizomicrobium sp.]|nr:hypothetical protein [Rhizomicrobium sp.]